MAGLTYQDIGGDNCPCIVGFQVRRCLGVNVAGLTVSVYTSMGGTLLASGTTTTGVLILAIPSAGSYWVTVTGQGVRFNAYAQTLALGCNAVATLTLVVASGYACFPGCDLPVATTLHGTIFASTAITLTHTGSMWQGAVSIYTVTVGASGFDFDITQSPYGECNATISGVSTDCSPWAFSGNFAAPNGAPCYITGSQPFTFTE